MKKINVSWAKTRKKEKTYVSPRITLPKKWLKEMGIDEDTTLLNLDFKDKKIILSKADETNDDI